jgi:hypothetical protein
MKRIEIPIPEHTTKEELKALILKHLEEASTDVSSSIEKIVIVAEDKMPGGDQGKG